MEEKWSRGFSMRMLNYIIIAFIAVVAFTLAVSVLKAGTGYGRTFVDLLFIVGAIIIGIGGFIGFFYKPTFREWYAVLIIIFGLALICLSVAIGTFLRF